MDYIIANRTDVGRERQVNEDSMTYFDSPNGHVVTVCDGMGGQAAGDVASKLACDIIRDILTNNNFPTAQEAITRAVLAANQGILHRASQNPDLEGMGSTCVIMIIKDNMVTYGWVGDSRIYVLDNHTLYQLSRDQSYVQTLVDSGELTVVEAENHPQKNEIVNALGIQEMTPPVIGYKAVEPGHEMIFMLCSDGLSNMVNHQQIERELNKQDISLQEKVDKLVFLANQYGGPDNITVQLVEFGAKQVAQAPRPAPHRRNKKNGISVTVISVLVLIAICLAIFAFFYKGSDPVEPAPPAPTEQTKPKKETARPSAPAPVQTNEVKNKTIIKQNPQKESPKPKTTTSSAKDVLKENHNGGKPVQEKSNNSNNTEQLLENHTSNTSTTTGTTPQSEEF